MAETAFAPLEDGRGRQLGPRVRPDPPQPHVALEAVASVHFGHRVRVLPQIVLASLLFVEEHAQVRTRIRAFVQIFEGLLVPVEQEEVEHIVVHFVDALPTAHFPGGYGRVAPVEVFEQLGRILANVENEGLRAEVELHLRVDLLEPYYRGEPFHIHVREFLFNDRSVDREEYRFV